MQLEELLVRLQGAGGREISCLAEVEEHVASGSLSKEEFIRVLDGLANPIRDINTKVSAAALKVMLTLVSASPEYLGGSQLNSVCNVTIDRVGDMKQPVRQAACQVIQAIILTQSLPRMLERLNKAFDHKNHRVREAMLEIIKSHLHQQGLADMTNGDVSKLLVPKLVTALSDGQASVRLASQETLTVLYSQVGESLMHMLEKHSIRPAQMRELVPRFEKAAAVPSMAGSESSQSAASSHHTQQHRPKSGGAGRRSVAASKLTGSSPVEEPITPLHVSTEAELMHELLSIGRELGANVDWEKRISALKRLHGLAIADASSYPAFADHLRANLRDTLVTQVADRRSQVCRAACNALTACTHACGQKFEHLAFSLIPELFKQLVVSIVVVADAADACMHAIVACCHSGRILKLFTDALLNDKSPKLRHRCAEYMHQALQEWPTSAFAREQQQLMRMGVTKAIEDASAETRVIGRSLFLTFAGIFREEVAGILKNVDPATALKLQRSLRDGEAGATASPSASHRGPFGGFSSTAASSRASSRPGAHGPSRLQTTSTDSFTGQRSRPPSHSPGIKTRYSSAPGMHSDSRHDSDGQVLTIGAALSQYAAAKSPTGPLSWSIAVALFEAVSHAVEHAATTSDDGAALLRPHMQPLKVALTEGLERNHTKVQLAALDAFATAFRVGCEAFEESIAALLPQVLALGSSRNQQMQAKAVALREDLGRRLPADSLLDAINSALAVTKLWYVKTAAFDLFSDHVGPSKPAGVPADTKALGCLATEAVHHVTSSSAEVKAAAIRVLCVMHGMRPDAVARTLTAQNTTNANHEEVLQAVREAIPSIDQDINAHLFHRHGDSATASHSRGSGSASRAGSAGSCGRDENRAPNRAEHTNGTKSRAATPQASSTSSGSGMGALVLTDTERLKVTRERMDKLLQSINDNPRHCAPALVQLKSAVRAVPDEVWLEQVQHVVSISMKLLLLMYYEVLEDACRMLMELVKARAALLQPYMQPLIDCLLDVYNALPVEQQPSLMKHVERLMDYMAQHMDVHALMEYYIAKFPAPKTIQAGTANTSRNCLRKMAIMARYTIMRCKGNPEHERDLLELLPGLHRTMDTDCAAVRMRTTEMWVAAFSVLGSRLQPYMESLSSSQKRIINLYISRMKPSPSLVNASTEQDAARIAAPAKQSPPARS